MSNKEAPKEIYLQYSGVVDDTWSSDRIDDSDTKYIRSDIHEESIIESYENGLGVGFRDHALKVQKEIEDLKSDLGLAVEYIDLMYGDYEGSTQGDNIFKVLTKLRDKL